MAQLQSYSTNQAELEELKNIGVNVWGQEQAVLEQQALDELTIYNNNLLKEKAGLKTNVANTNVNKLESGSTLDISSYLKTQENLKKQQDYKRSLLLSDKSKLIADHINSKQSKCVNKAKRCRRNLKHGQKRTSDAANIDLLLINKGDDESNANKSGSEYIPSDGDSDYDQEYCTEKGVRNVKKVKLTTNQTKSKQTKVIDDGNMKCYQERLNQYYKKLESENQQAFGSESSIPESEVLIGEQLKCSSLIWNALYHYQCDGVRWLWDIHRKVSGGLLGDEMGLGKTVQVIAFLYSLNYTGHASSYGGFKGLGPTLIVCPSTVIHQWVKHFHDWAPEFRVSILHQSGSFVGKKRDLIRDNIQSKGILITTYESMLKYKAILTEQNWHYVILDEGHKIRNPSAQISEAVKLFKTPHRLLLTGSPMQNNLQELWSLFDFVRPGMLGTLQVFVEHFAMPIVQGGYANASPMQEALALSMATALKDLITPYLLRRAKSDVARDIRLPAKSEQVLFCSITPEQHDLYKGYLMSDHVGEMLGRGGRNWFSEGHMRANVLRSITTLRKICNHPDIYLNDMSDDSEDGKGLDDKNGFYKRSGKMVVVAALLKMWKKQSHRVLLFTQSRAMVALFARFLETNGYKFLCMDGATSVVARQPLIDKFNNDISIDVFVLTTRVGGLGVNLTGADRVIIYDPDWNPATDAQARERAWRIGQRHAVTIYRLVSAGTIEEKMYERQVWKQLLGAKVLLDPHARRFFRSADLHDLFALPLATAAPHDANIFRKARIALEEKTTTTATSSFSRDQVESMRQRAAQIAKSLSTSPTTPLQKEMLAERQAKLAKRAQLQATLAPAALLRYNRAKLIADGDDTHANQFDGRETDVGFAKALVVAGKAGEMYRDACADAKRVDSLADEYATMTSALCRKTRRERLDDDFSVRVEGERIEGVVKRRRQQKRSVAVSDCEDYVLSKLLARKGVQSALQHDSLVRCTSSSEAQPRLKLHSETQHRTDLALQALRRSRIRRQHDL